MNSSIKLILKEFFFFVSFCHILQGYIWNAGCTAHHNTLLCASWTVIYKSWQAEKKIDEEKYDSLCKSKSGMK